MHKHGKPSRHFLLFEGKVVSVESVILFRLIQSQNVKFVLEALNCRIGDEGLTLRVDQH